MPHARIWLGVMPFIAALVAQKIKFGVSTSPWGVERMPKRPPDLASLWVMLNRKFLYMVILALQFVALIIQ